MHSILGTGAGYTILQLKLHRYTQTRCWAHQLNAMPMMHIVCICRYHSFKHRIEFRSTKSEKIKWETVKCTSLVVRRSWRWCFYRAQPTMHRIKYKFAPVANGQWCWLIVIIYYCECWVAGWLGGEPWKWGNEKERKEERMPMGYSKCATKWLEPV